MANTIKLTAIAAYGMSGQFVARVKGRHAKFTFEYEFLGRKSGKRGEVSSADVDDPGLYVERNVDRKGNKDDSFWIVGIDPADGKFSGIPCSKANAMGLAKEIDLGTVIDWSAEIGTITTPPAVVAPVLDLNRSGLESERSTLVARLAEIDALLGAQ